MKKTEKSLRKKEITTIAIESLVAETILSFCENLAELGCPIKSEPDMWFRYLSPEEQFEVAEKLLFITERDSKRFKKNER